MEKISVAIRCRPETCASLPGDRQWRIEDNRITLHRPLGSPVSGVSFAFDHVFDCSSTNCMVYNLLIKSIIDAAVDGFNGTAFAYGQTSSGKTHTMNGSEEEPGITQLAVGDIFNNIKMIKDREFLIRVSYMEIYNEEINDLLSLGSERLPIHESLDRGIYVAGLREEIVNSAEQVLKLIKLGEANRRFGETNMNVRSSRSHTIFRMVIESSAKDSIGSGDFQNADAIRVSVLNLVDLAGSERIAKTGADGVRLKEGKYINKSLMILGNVINKLSDGGKQRGHIPYRDSKLTRILQPALGGNAKTSIICTVAPEEVHVEETKGTLQFASRAKRITNCAQVNEILTDAALLKRQKLEIEELRRKLQGSHSEVLEQVILKERNDMLKSELDREKLAMELQEEKRSRALLEKQVREQQIMIENLSSIASSSDGNVQLSQGTYATGSCFNEAINGGDSSVKKTSFQTPNFKNMRSDFVARRRRTQLISPVSSPVPEIAANVADEDAWFQLNNGHLTDLDLLQMTPSLKSNSFSSSDTSTEPITKEEAGDDEKCPFLRSECSEKMDLLESTMKQLAILERENSLLKEEKASLEETLSASTENIKLLESEKEELLKDLSLERQNMADLRGQIKLFSLEYAQRERLLVSLHSKSRAMVESFRACPIPKPAQSEC